MAWRSRRATAIRLVAPFVFLLLALIINVALDANSANESRVAAQSSTSAVPIGPIPDCTQDLYIGAGKPCLTFVYTPNNDSQINVSGARKGMSTRVPWAAPAAPFSLSSVNASPVPQSHDRPLANCLPAV